jgi:hypothetical protein
MMAISGPSMLIAWLKLRQRNMGPILDANGWAVNGRVKLNVPFGASLTSVGHVPAGSAAPVADAFGEKKSAWPGIVKLVVIVSFLTSLVNHFGLIYMGAKLVGMRKVPMFVRKPESLKTEILGTIASLDPEHKAKVERSLFKGTDAEWERLDTDGDGSVTALDASDRYDEKPAPAGDKKN